MPSCNLLITYVEGEEDPQQARKSARILIQSLFNTLFSGEIFVLLPSEHPLFMQKREMCGEFYSPQISKLLRQELPPEEMLLQAFRLGLPVQDFDKIIFCSSSAMALRNIDHLFDYDTPRAIWNEKNLFLVSSVDVLPEFLEAMAATRKRSPQSSLGGKLEDGEIDFRSTSWDPQSALLFCEEKKMWKILQWKIALFMRHFHFPLINAMTEASTS